MSERVTIEKLREYYNLFIGIGDIGTGSFEEAFNTVGIPMDAETAAVMFGSIEFTRVSMVSQYGVTYANGFSTMVAFLLGYMVGRDFSEHDNLGAPDAF